MLFSDTEIINLPNQEQYKCLPPVDLGLEAGKNGDFTTARQMFMMAIEQLDWQLEKQSEVIELMVKVADCYASESAWDLAKRWYSKALERASSLPAKNALQIALIMARLAELVLPSLGIAEFDKSFERLQAVSLVAQDINIKSILGVLEDVSWTLFVKGYPTQGQYINGFIEKIEQLRQGNTVSSSWRLAA